MFTCIQITDTPYVVGRVVHATKNKWRRLLSQVMLSSMEREERLRRRELYWLRRSTEQRESRLAARREPERRRCAGWSFIT